MTGLYWGLAAVLLATITVGFVRVLVGPSAPDRLLAPQLFGTAATAILLILAEATATPSLRHLALLLAALAVINIVAFVRVTWPEPERGPEPAPPPSSGDTR